MTIILLQIKLKSNTLCYGDCYLGYPYHQFIELINDTDLPARYVLLKQDENAKTIYAYGSKSSTGVIRPHSIHQIDFELQVKRLGQIGFPIFIKIIGAEENPLAIDISANGLGPNVSLSTKELNWSKISVLKESPLNLFLKNGSPISAEFSCMTVSDHSVFRIEPSHGLINPGQEVCIKVTAYLDDTIKFADIMKVSVQSDGVHEVQLVAKGTGSTIAFDSNLKLVDFKDVFSNRECTAEFVMVNRGRRTQNLYWQSEEKGRFGAKDNKGEERPSVFEVIPNRYTLRPGGKKHVLIRGFSGNATVCTETMICQATIDKDPNRKVVVESQVKANFINPLLEMSPSELQFISTHLHDGDFEIISKDVTLTNTSALPLHLVFKCPEPYQIDLKSTVSLLNPGDSTILTVNFDPSFHEDRLSRKDSSKLIISYPEHPQRDVIELSSEVSFPNLTFSENVVDFGSIAKDTIRKRFFNMTNTGSLPIHYSWYFLEDSISMKHLGSDEDVSSKSSIFLIDQTFDILPLSGILQPGEVENVEVCFSGFMDGRYFAQAICNVQGGPEYDLSLQGEASSIEYQLDKHSLDFGSHLYQDIFEQDITISNTGLVDFDFSVIIPSGSSLEQKLMISPPWGSVQSMCKQKLVIRFCSGVPESINESILLQIAHYEPVKINVTGTGTFPSMLLGIPRVKDSAFEEIMSTVIKTKKSKNSFDGPPNGVALAGYNNAAVAVNSITAIASTAITSSAVAEESLTVSEEQLEKECGAEAERLFLKEKTLEFLKKMNEDIKSKSNIISKFKFIGSSIIALKASSIKEKKASASSLGSISESSQIVLSKFVCDFGNVIRNISKKKSFKIYNRGHHVISLQLDRSGLTGSGFTIEPDKAKLSPSSSEFLEFQVSFSSKLATDLGVVSVDVPVLVAGGPTMILTLRADITVPDVLPSTREINFGEVICGQRKSVAVQLQNINSVPCDWSFNPADIDAEIIAKQKAKPTVNTAIKKKVGSNIAKDISISPASGTLQPGEKALVFIRYSPSEERKIDANLPIRINLNPKAVMLRLIGSGLHLGVVFEPGTLSIGPILPCSEGVEAKIQAYNPHNYPIEIYSLEFDQLYLEEEQILKHIEAGPDSILYLPPREPGQPLPDYITEAGIKMIKQEKMQGVVDVSGTAPGGTTMVVAATTTAPAVAPATTAHSTIASSANAAHSHAATGHAATSSDDHNRSNLQKTSVVVPSPLSASVSAASGQPFQLADQGATQDPSQYPANIVIHGPPYGGRTTQAKKICKLLGHVYIRIDDVVDSYKAEVPEVQRREVNPPEEDKGVSIPHTTLLPTAVAPPTVVVEYTTSNNTGEQRVQVEAVEGDVAHRLNLTEEAILDIIRARLNKDDCSKNGFVIDGLESKYLSSPMSLVKNVIKQLSKKLVMFHLRLEVQAIHERELKALRSQGDKDAEVFRYKELSEEDYDALPDEEKIAYEAAMIRYKSRMKGLMDKRKNERRQWEEEAASKIGERKVEEDKSGKKKKPNQAPSNQKAANEKSQLVSKDKQDTKPAKGSTSPKLGKKVEKANDKNFEKLLEKGQDKPGDLKVGGAGGPGDRMADSDDSSSRMMLLEMIDAFFSDSTFR